MEGGGGEEEERRRRRGGEEEERRKKEEERRRNRGKAPPRRGTAAEAVWWRLEEEFKPTLHRVRTCAIGASRLGRRVTTWLATRVTLRENALFLRIDRNAFWKGGATGERDNARGV